MAAKIGCYWNHLYARVERHDQQFNVRYGNDKPPPLHENRPEQYEYYTVQDEVLDRTTQKELAL